MVGPQVASEVTAPGHARGKSPLSVYVPVKSGTGGLVVISDTVCCSDLGFPAKLPPKADAAAVPADSNDRLLTIASSSFIRTTCHSRCCTGLGHVKLYRFARLASRFRCMSLKPQCSRSQLRMIGTSGRSARMEDLPANAKHKQAHIGANKANFMMVCGQFGCDPGCICRYGALDF